MNDSNVDPLFEPDAAFAAEWNVDNPLAQGALKHASVTVLNAIEEAWEEIDKAEPDFEDLGPLGAFPRGMRPALTPLLLRKLHAAAVLVGWKLAQPGTPLPPGCIGEELMLELIRREAVEILELEGAPEASISATRGVYEVCEDDDVLDLFEMQEPADAAIALSDPINVQMGKADMRIGKWFEPFHGGGPGYASHPLYTRSPEPAAGGGNGLEIVQPKSVEDAGIAQHDADFRVSVRTWSDDFPERDEFDQMPASWLYYVQAPTADAARESVLDQFPQGAVQHIVFDDAEEVRLDRDDVARISIDVQRLGLPQVFKQGSAFHLIGEIADDFPEQGLATLAGYLDATFPVSVIARRGGGAFFGVTVNAESHEEAEADFSEAMEGIATAIDFDRDPADGYSCGQGTRDSAALLTEIEAYRSLG